MLGGGRGINLCSSGSNEVPSVRGSASSSSLDVRLDGEYRS